MPSRRDRSRSRSRRRDDHSRKRKRHSRSRSDSRDKGRQAPPPQFLPPDPRAQHTMPSQPVMQAPHSVPVATSNQVDYENPQELYRQQAGPDYSSLPPGWEKVFFKGRFVYLDHLSRTAHTDPPNVVWAGAQR